MIADAPAPVKPERKRMPGLQPGPAKPKAMAMPRMGGGPGQPLPGPSNVKQPPAEADLAAILQPYQKVRMMAEEAQTELRLMPESAPDQEKLAGWLKVLRSLAEELKKRATACCDKGGMEKNRRRKTLTPGMKNRKRAKKPPRPNRKPRRTIDPARNPKARPPAGQTCHPGLAGGFKSRRRKRAIS